MPERAAIKPIYLVLIAVLLWSTGGLFIKLTTLDAYQITFWRSLLAAITVIALTYKQGLKINAFGMMTSVIYAVLLFLFVWATKHTTAANAIFLQYTAPIYILILGPFVIGEKFHLRDAATVAFCLIGMSLFFVGDLTVGDYQGNLAALGSGIFLGLYIMLLKHPRAAGSEEVGGRSEEDRSVPPAVEGGAFGSGSPPYTAKHWPSIARPERGVAAGSGTKNDASAKAAADGVVLSADPKPKTQSPKTNPAISVIYGNLLLAIVTVPAGISAAPTMTPTDIAAVSFLGIIQIGIAYILFIKGVTRGTRPLDASIIGFIEPLLNPVWVFLFIGEKPAKWAILGGTIIIATVVAHTVAQYRSHSRLCRPMSGKGVPFRQPK